MYMYMYGGGVVLNTRGGIKQKCFCSFGQFSPSSACRWSAKPETWLRFKPRREGGTTRHHAERRTNDATSTRFCAALHAHTHPHTHTHSHIPAHTHTPTHTHPHTHTGEREGLLRHTQCRHLKPLTHCPSLNTGEREGLLRHAQRERERTPSERGSERGSERERMRTRENANARASARENEASSERTRANARANVRDDSVATSPGVTRAPASYDTHGILLDDVRDGIIARASCVGARSHGIIICRAHAHGIITCHAYAHGMLDAALLTRAASRDTSAAGALVRRHTSRAIIIDDDATFHMATACCRVLRCVCRAPQLWRHARSSVVRCHCPTGARHAGPLRRRAKGRLRAPRQGVCACVRACARARARV